MCCRRVVAVQHVEHARRRAHLGHSHLTVADRVNLVGEILGRERPLVQVIVGGERASRAVRAQLANVLYLGVALWLVLIDVRRHCPSICSSDHHAYVVHDARLRWRRVLEVTGAHRRLVLVCVYAYNVCCKVVASLA